MIPVELRLTHAELHIAIGPGEAAQTPTPQSGSSTF